MKLTAILKLSILSLRQSNNGYRMQKERFLDFKQRLESWSQMHRPVQE